MKPKIKTIVFDIGGVLQLGRNDEKGLDGGAHTYMAKKFKLDIDSWFDAIDTPYGKSMDGSITRMDCIEKIAENLRTNPTKLIKLFHKAYNKFFKKNARLFKIAKKLKKQGYKIGILSDQWYLSADILASKKDMKMFNPVIISFDVKMRKPSSKIYKLLIKKCKCKSKEIVFIDNRKWNMIPAQKLGIKTILFTDNKKCVKDLKKLGVDL